MGDDKPQLPPPQERDVTIYRPDGLPVDLAKAKPVKQIGFIRRDAGEVGR